MFKNSTSVYSTVLPRSNPSLKLKRVSDVTSQHAGLTSPEGGGVGGRGERGYTPFPAYVGQDYTQIGLKRKYPF
jgi:hypothetical protein